MGEIASFEKGRSPFNPGQPVSPDLFVGRREQIGRMLRAVGQVALGKQQNIYVTGEYGIGKSSLIAYVRSAAEANHQIAGFHVFLGGVNTIEEMVIHVVSRVIQQAHASNMLDRLKGFLAKYVRDVEFFGVHVNLDALRNDAPELAQDFLPFLRRVWQSLEDAYRGMALYLDDLNGIAKAPRFAPMLKSLVDEIAVSGNGLPLLLVLGGVPERRAEMIQCHQPVERVFDVVSLSPLDPEEAKQFFVRAFRSVNMTVNEGVEVAFAYWSGGLPKLMHEIGEAVYWQDRDGVVDDNDMASGVIIAADIVGEKYFEPVRQAIRSSDYHSILRKLGKLFRPDLRLEKAELAKGLSPGEQKKLNNFLQRMKRLHVLTPGEVRGEWVFPNRLVAFYLLMESSRERKGKLAD